MKKKTITVNLEKILKTNLNDFFEVMKFGNRCDYDKALKNNLRVLRKKITEDLINAFKTNEKRQS